MRIIRTSQLTGVTHARELDVTQEQLEQYLGGGLAQVVFPRLSASDREFIMTGVTEEEWQEHMVPEWAATEAERLCALARAQPDDGALTTELTKSLRVAYVMTQLKMEENRAYAVICTTSEENNGAVAFATTKPPTRETLRRIGVALALLAKDVLMRAG